ncbi:hypothetical protein BGW39_010249 [Mortierella sp. 14UC]|nr:hypothetical protein BGW39_010249 [Mortierella sp. 14UC]
MESVCCTGARATYLLRTPTSFDSSSLTKPPTNYRLWLTSRNIYLEPVAALLSVPSKPSNQDHSLVVASAKGTVSWSKITQPDQEEGRPVATTPKTFSLDLDVQTAFVTENHLYVLTGPGRVLRLPLESLGSMDNKDLEIMDLPPLCALSLILSHDSTAVEGLYGLNQRGQLLRFPADWTKHARPQGVVNARDTVGRALSELKRLSDQVKRLEIQCQLENQRIATYNRLVFELQQSVLASSSRQDVSHGSSGGEDVEMELDIEPGLLVETSVSTFSHIVSNGFEGTKRFYARLRVKSRANIDWSSGWSVGVNVASKVEFCPHGKPTATSQHNTGTNTRMHHQTFASLRTLNRHSPWTLDIELDREMVHSLPLQVSIGLLFRELGDASGTSDNFKSDEGGFAAYFVLDSVDLDVLDFVEGVEDPLKRDVPAFVQHQPRSRPTTTTNNADSKDEGEQEGCIQCKVEIGDSSDAGAGTEMNKKDAASLFRPIEFEIDTTSIPIAQCLPALLFLEGCDHDGSSRAVKVVDMAAAGGGRKQGMGLGMSVGIEVRMKAQASFRTCFVLPEECLTSSGLPVIRPIIPTSAKQLQGQGHRNTFRIDNDAMAVRSFGKPWGSGVDVAGLTGLAGGHGQIEDPDFGMVWVDLIEGPALSAAAAGSGSGGSYGRQQQEQHGRGQPKEGVVKAHVLVRGSDFERVFVVRQALERRIHALFD